MKKLVLVLLAIALLASSALAETMMVHVTATCYDTNNIGSYWQGAYFIGDYQTYDGDVVELYAGKYDITTQIGEYDNSPDIGTASSTYNITQNRLNNGFTIEQVVIVEENRGTYRGNWCEWYVTYEFTPCVVGVNYYTIH